MCGHADYSGARSIGFCGCWCGCWCCRCRCRVELVQHLRVLPGCRCPASARAVLSCCLVIVVRCWPCPALPCCRAAGRMGCAVVVVQVLPLSSICACRAAGRMGCAVVVLPGGVLRQIAFPAMLCFCCSRFTLFHLCRAKCFRHSVIGSAPSLRLPCCRAARGAGFVVLFLLRLWGYSATPAPASVLHLLLRCPSARCPVSSLSGGSLVECCPAPALPWCSVVVACLLLCWRAAGANNPLPRSNGRSTVAGEGVSRRCGSVRTPPQILPPKPFSAGCRSPLHPCCSSEL